MSGFKPVKERIQQRLGCGEIPETGVDMVHAVASMVELDLPHFSVLRHLGAGAYGCVFLAQPRDDLPIPEEFVGVRAVVVKAQVGALLDSVPFQCHDGALYLAMRVAREVYLACNLAPHPRLPQVYRVFHNPESAQDGPAGTDVYICMEYATGGTLWDILASPSADRPITPLFSQALARGTVEALAQLHEWGIAHRDVKLDNMLVTTRHYPLSHLPEAVRSLPEVRAKCTMTPTRELIYRDDHWVLAADFGLARPLVVGLGATVVTLDVATPGFQAPELLVKRRGETHGMVDSGKADAWSIGVVLAAIAAPKSAFARKLMEWRVNDPSRVLGPPDDEACERIAAIRGVTPQAVRETFAVFRDPLPPPPPPPAGDCVSALLSWNPDRRPTLAEVLDTPWLATAPCMKVPVASGQPPPLAEAALNLARNDAERVANVRHMVVEQVARKWAA